MHCPGPQFVVTVCDLVCSEGASCDLDQSLVTFLFLVAVTLEVVVAMASCDQSWLKSHLVAEILCDFASLATQEITSDCGCNAVVHSGPAV